jgi:hypothetical protein
MRVVFIPDSTLELGRFSASDFTYGIEHTFKPSEPLLVYGKLKKTRSNYSKLDIDLYLIAMPKDKSSRAAFEWAIEQVEEGLYEWENINTHPTNASTLRDMKVAAKYYPCMWLPVVMTLSAHNKHSKHVLEKLED